jgi:prepilin-type N-terminal cleavage/methylation domain-containing protein
VKIRAARAIRRAGFTLLELVLAMLVMAIVIGMVFFTFSQNLQLGNTVAERQNEESQNNAFFDMMKKLLGTLPGNTRMELVSKDAGRQYLSDLTLQNVPLAFTWGNTEKIAKAVQLSTVQRRDGYLDIVLKYYEEEILQDSDNQQVNTDVEPFAELVLLEDVRTFEWVVLDGRTMEEAYDWDLVGRLPLQMELTIAFGAQGEFMKQTFWIPPKQDPEVMMRQLQQQRGGAGGGGGGNINIPGGGRGGDGPRGGGGDGPRGDIRPGPPITPPRQ